MTARVTAENYAAMKAFCCWFWDQQSSEWDRNKLPAEHRPRAVLESFERRSTATAREGVRQSIGDIIEQTQDLTAEQALVIDEELAANGLPTLSQVRLDFSGKIHGIMRRGRVRSETEYHALRNVADAMNDAERARAWELLGEFEMSQSSIRKAR